MIRTGNLHDLDHHELESKSGEKFSLSAVLTDTLGFKDIFIHHEVLLPGRRLSSPHSHSHREEMILVMEGHPTARHEGKSFDMKPGDFVGFQPGGEGHHVIENNTNTDVRLLVIASNPKEDHVQYETSL